MASTKYQLEIFHRDDVWTGILRQKGRTTLEIEAPDVRSLLHEIAEAIAYREDSPISQRLDAYAISKEGRRS